MEWVIRDLPQPLLAIGTFLLLSLAAFAGNKLRNRQSADHGLGSTQEGYVVSAVLGLLALLIGFTFSMAVDRQNNRLVLVTAEANAIASAYAFAQTFGEPQRSELSALLLAYASNRLSFGKATDQDQAAAIMTETQRLQNRIGTSALAAVATVRDDVSALFLESTVEMFEAAEMRVVARQAHIPTRVYTVLFIYMIISAAVLGFAFAGSPQVVTNGTLFVLITISMVLIVDLDRPTSGHIIESQSAMDVMKSRMERSNSAQLARAALSANRSDFPDMAAASPK